MAWVCGFSAWSLEGMVGPLSKWRTGGLCVWAVLFEELMGHPGGGEDGSRRGAASQWEHPQEKGRAGPTEGHPERSRCAGRRLFKSRAADKTQDVHLNLISRYITQHFLVSAYLKYRMDECRRLEERETKPEG